MAKFKVAVEWSCYGNVSIEADSLEDAIHIAKSDPSIQLPDGEYIEDSWQVNDEITREIN